MTVVFDENWSLSVSPGSNYKKKKKKKRTFVFLFAHLPPFCLKPDQQPGPPCGLPRNHVCGRSVLYSELVFTSAGPIHCQQQLFVFISCVEVGRRALLSIKTKLRPMTNPKPASESTFSMSLFLSPSPCESLFSSRSLTSALLPLSPLPSS